MLAMLEELTNNKFAGQCTTNRAADIIFSLDGSTNVKTSNFSLTLKFIYDTVNSLNVGTGVNDVRIGLTQWSSWTWNHIKLASQDKATVMNNICPNGVCTTCFTCIPATIQPDVSDQITNCTANILEIGGSRLPSDFGDGFCDDYFGANTPSCSWDKGDCCRSTCRNNTYTCGRNATYVCLNSAGEKI